MFLNDGKSKTNIGLYADNLLHLCTSLANNNYSITKELYNDEYEQVMRFYIKVYKDTKENNNQENR